MRSRDDAKERATVEENGGETTARRSQRAAANTDNPLNLTVSQLQAQARELSMLRYKHAAQSKPATKRKKTARRRLDGGGGDDDDDDDDMGSEDEMPPPPLPPSPNKKAKPVVDGGAEEEMPPPPSPPPANKKAKTVVGGGGANGLADNETPPRDKTKERQNAAAMEENGGETTARRSQRAAAKLDNPLNLTFAEVEAQARMLSRLKYEHAARSKPATKRKQTARRRLDGGGNDEDTESEEEMPPPPLPPPPAQPTHRKALLPPSRFRGEMLNKSPFWRVPGSKEDRYIGCDVVRADKVRGHVVCRCPSTGHLLVDFEDNTKEHHEDGKSFSVHNDGKITLSEAMKALKDGDDPTLCQLCNQRADYKAPLAKHLGVVVPFTKLIGRTTRNYYAHTACVCFSSKIVQDLDASRRGGWIRDHAHFVENEVKALAKKAGNKCAACKKGKAFVGCKNPKCTMQWHLPCLMQQILDAKKKAEEMGVDYDGPRIYWGLAPNGNGEDQPYALAACKRHVHELPTNDPDVEPALTKQQRSQLRNGTADDEGIIRDMETQLIGSGHYGMSRPGMSKAQASTLTMQERLNSGIRFMPTATDQLQDGVRGMWELTPHVAPMVVGVNNADMPKPTIDAQAACLDTSTTAMAHADRQWQMIKDGHLILHRGNFSDWRDDGKGSFTKLDERIFRGMNTLDVLKLRQHQLEPLRAITSGKHDVLCCMATGFGKSLFYRLAVATDHEFDVTLYIAPTISLLNDQAAKLEKANIGAIHAVGMGSAEPGVVTHADRTNNAEEMAVMVVEATERARANRHTQFAKSRTAMELLRKLIEGKNPFEGRDRKGGIVVLCTPEKLVGLGNDKSVFSAATAASTSDPDGDKPSELMSLLRRLAQQQRLKRIVLDEAETIIDWGGGGEGWKSSYAHLQQVIPKIRKDTLDAAKAQQRRREVQQQQQQQQEQQLMLVVSSELHKEAASSSGAITLAPQHNAQKKDEVDVPLTECTTLLCLTAAPMHRNRDALSTALGRDWVSGGQLDIKAQQDASDPSKKPFALFLGSTRRDNLIIRVHQREAKVSSLLGAKRSLTSDHVGHLMKLKNEIETWCDGRGDTSMLPGIQAPQGSARGGALIFVLTKKNAEDMAKRLSEVVSLPGAVSYYHGSLSAEEKLKKEEAWQNGSITCLVSTSAMNHGVDHPNLRYVAFWSLPTSVATLYQGFGRAGRDGNPSLCELYYNIDDLKLAERVLSHPFGMGTSKQNSKQRSELMDGLMQVLEFGHSSECRCKTLERLMDDQVAQQLPNCEMCDVCTIASFQEEDFVELGNVILDTVNKYSIKSSVNEDVGAGDAQQVRKTSSLWTVGQLIGFLMREGSALRSETRAGLLKDDRYGWADNRKIRKHVVEHVITQMVLDKFLRLELSVSGSGGSAGADGSAAVHQNFHHRITVGDRAIEWDGTKYLSKRKDEAGKYEESIECHECGKDGSLTHCCKCDFWFCSDGKCRQFTTVVKSSGAENPDDGDADDQMCSICLKGKTKMTAKKSTSGVERRANKRLEMSKFERDREVNMDRNARMLRKLGLTPGAQNQNTGRKRTAATAGLALVAPGPATRPRRRILDYDDDDPAKDVPIAFKIREPRDEREMWLKGKTSRFQETFREMYSSLTFWRVYATEVCCTRAQPHWDIFYQDGDVNMALLEKIITCAPEDVQAHLYQAFQTYWKDSGLDSSAHRCMNELFGDSPQAQRALSSFNELTERVSQYLVPSYDMGAERIETTVRVKSGTKQSEDFDIESLPIHFSPREYKLPKHDVGGGDDEATFDGIETIGKYNDFSQGAVAEVSLRVDEKSRKPYLHITPLHPTIDRGSTVTRRFGSHRFLRLHVNVDADAVAGVDTLGNAAQEKEKIKRAEEKEKLLMHLLANEPRLNLGGRQWSYLCGKPLDSQLIFFAVKKSSGECNFKELNKMVKVNAASEFAAVESYKHKVDLTVCDQLRREIVPENEENVSKAYYKFASRHALGFSSTHPSIRVKIENVTIIADDAHDDGRATDGAGMISKQFAQRVQHALNLKHLPSAFQARVLAFGAKGVWSIVDPWPDKYKRYEMVIRESQIKFRGVAQMALSPNQGQSPYVFRKDESWKLEFAVCNYSKARECGKLNKQIIPVLELRGMRPETLNKLAEKAEVLARDESSKLLELRGKDLERMLRRIASDNHGGQAADVLRAIKEGGFDANTEPHLRSQLHMLAKQMRREAVQRFRIPIEKSMKGMFVPDPTNTLKEGEIFVHVTRQGPDDTPYGTIEGTVLVYQSPCLLESDVMKLRAVDPRLTASIEEKHLAEAGIDMSRYLRDVIVLNRKDAVGIASRLSGGDLDGDIGVVVWDEDLVNDMPDENVDPPSQEDERSALDGVVDGADVAGGEAVHDEGEGHENKEQAMESSGKRNFRKATYPTGHEMVRKHALENLGTLTLVRLLSTLHMDRIDLWITIQREVEIRRRELNERSMGRRTDMMSSTAMSTSRVMELPNSHRQELLKLAFANRAALDAPKHGGCSKVHAALMRLPCISSAKNSSSSVGRSLAHENLYATVPTPHYSGRARRQERRQEGTFERLGSLSHAVLESGLAYQGVRECNAVQFVTKESRTTVTTAATAAASQRRSGMQVPQKVFESMSSLAQISEVVFRKPDDHESMKDVFRGTTVDDELEWNQWKLFEMEARCLLERMRAATTNEFDFDDDDANDVSARRGEVDTKRSEVIMSIEQKRRLVKTMFNHFVLKNAEMTLMLNQVQPGALAGTTYLIASAMYIVGNRMGDEFRDLAWYSCGDLFITMKRNPILKRMNELPLTLNVPRQRMRLQRKPLSLAPPPTGTTSLEPSADRQQPPASASEDDPTDDALELPPPPPPEAELVGDLDVGDMDDEQEDEDEFVDADEDMPGFFGGVADPYD